MSMRHFALALAALTVVAPVLAACDSLDNFELFDSKKKLTGERKPVFPDGVPGVTSGIPPDLMKGYREPETALPDPVAAAAEAAARPVVKPKLNPEPNPEPKPQRTASRPPPADPNALRPSLAPTTSATAPAAKSTAATSAAATQPAPAPPRPPPPQSAPPPWPAVQPQAPWPASPASGTATQ